MISTGSWDYKSMKIQANQTGFDIGVFPFPLPLKTDSVYGEFFDGRPSESSYIGTRYGICRYTKHPDVALKFLKFITSVEINEKVNDFFGWIPGTRTTQVAADVQPFIPITEGMPTMGNDILTNIGSKTNSNDIQNYWEYISGKKTFSEYVNALTKRFVIDGMADFLLEIRTQQQQLPLIEFVRSYYSLLWKTEQDTMEQTRFINKLSYLTDSYSFQKVNNRVNCYELIKAASLDNRRAKELRGVSDYKIFLKDFTTAAP
jgi:hypothetical protein